MTSAEVEKDVVKVRSALDYPSSGVAAAPSERYLAAVNALDRLAELAHRYVGVSK